MEAYQKYKERWKNYCEDYKEYRKGYMRWKFALKRGNKADLKDYFHDKKLKKYVRYKKGKTRKYANTIRLLRLALATPKWINIKEMIEIYENCPKGMTIDHIIPIHNKNVCGLHVPWNLQYLSREDNSKKHNKFKLIKKHKKIHIK